MTIRLQQFGHKESRYERPTQDWVCGWSAEGRPCPMGPDGVGRCSAELQGKCEPVRKGDRWFCTRPEVFGGPCDPGPRPDGACCHPKPEHPVCQPRLSLRARRGRLTAACVALAVGLLSLLIAGPWGSSFIDPGPLASHHAVVQTLDGPRGDYCFRCHASDSKSGGLLQPVTDGACLKCHIAEAHHPARSVAESVLWPDDDFLGRAPMAHRCTGCHTEHRGRDHQLSRVLDRACTQCHADLTPWRRAGSGAEHLPTLAPPRVEPVLAGRSADRVTSFAHDHPEARVLAGKHIDATPIRFEHQVHMATDDTMQQRIAAWTVSLRERGATAAEIPVRKVGDGKLALTCAACHRPDSGGRYMLPIQFGTHCVQCHELGTKSVAGKDLPIPHGSLVGPFIRQVAAETVVAAAAVPASEQTPELPSTPKRGPGGSRGPGAKAPQPATEKSPADGVAEETRKLNQRLSTTCGKCHDPAASPAEMADPMIPRRWFSAAVFGHETHQFIDCADCHHQAAQRTAAPFPDDSPLKWTGRTKELMLPPVESCRQCHAPQATTTTVRHDCALCHDYHAPKRELSLAGPKRP